MKGRKTGGRKKGVSNRISATIVAEARASGLSPHDMSVWHARQAFAREMGLREAADDPNIDPLRKKELHNASPYYAPKKGVMPAKIMGIPTPCRNLFQPDSCS